MLLCGEPTCLEGEAARLMLLMLRFGGPLGVWKVKRQGSAAADAPVWGASRCLGMALMLLMLLFGRRSGSDFADAPVWRASRCLEGEMARL